ncbi:phosphoribosyltransferase family protein [Sphaerisporangium sp. TRM90804]|uniref:ComF family protein n=1 Tax=Sphaerisporangium sp. TRM90804 TaxID=3031113 RepID=UPI0024471416|nr:phosphoribosyltransferase family protein [Sphaerisporangium sp. TRM90804]MDH2427858.1 phosphoribosyltransferase family protein [Sphaerisporangium sp. TRM90804]
MLSAWLDLLLPPACAGCARPGAVLCRGCAGELCGDPRPRPPGHVPGLPDCWSAARYEGAARRAILAYKERGRTALAAPLAACLASALLAAPRPPGAALALVPVPSARAAVRRRGHDPVRRLAALAVPALRARGWPAVLAPVLRQRRRVRDQAGLGASQRAENLAGAFGVVGEWDAAQRRVWGRARAVAVVVDDIVTTGATLAEAAAALRREGVEVPLAVTLAATPRRPGGPGRRWVIPALPQPVR